MRDDMSKVVTERPRQGHGNKSKKTTGQRIRRYDPDREYDGLAYSNDRTYMGRASDYPIEGIYVHPKTGLIREQSHARIRWRRRKHR